MELPEENYQFTRRQRLLTAGDFSKVFDKPEFKTGVRGITLLAVKNSLNYARLGVIVGKKKVRYANGRNCIKRQARESFRLHQHQIESLDIVLIAKHDAGSLNKNELRACLDRLWKKLRNQSKG